MKDKARELNHNVESNLDLTQFKNHLETISHGTHIVGILLGKKLGNPSAPFGVANEATFYGLAALNPIKATKSNILSILKIINNSWATPNNFPLINPWQKRTQDQIKHEDHWCEVSKNALFSYGIRCYKSSWILQKLYQA